MAIQKISNGLIYCLAADTKPTTLANNALAYVVDTGDVYKSTGGSWAIISDGPASTATLTNKTMVAASNTITDTSATTGDILRHNGTRFVRKGIGTTLQVLRTNSGATDIEWASLNAENTGKATASGNGSTTVFNIAHSIGSTPSVFFASCSSLTTTYTYTADATNIVVTFSSAPASGTNNVVIQWRAVA